MDITDQTIRARGRTLPATGQGVAAEAGNARELLKGMRAELVQADGSIRPGYLRIRTAGAQRHLEAQSRWRWGDKSDARRLVHSLVERAYSERLTPAARTALNEALQAYFARSGRRVGTQSFVRLVDTLEGIAGPTSDTHALTPLARLNLEPVARLALEDINPAAPGQSAEGPFGSGHAKLFGSAQAQLTALKTALEATATDEKTRHTARLFQHLLAPPKINPPDLVRSATAPVQHVVGDADGSLCRVLISAIASGHLSLSPAGIQQLASLMHDEAASLFEADRVAYQTNPAIAVRFDALINEIRVHPSADGRRLVFMGDLLHDRLSNNKQALGRLIERLSGRETQRADGSPGVVFILGNHDVFEEVAGAVLQNSDVPEHRVYREQNGFFAARDLTAEQSNQLSQHCFKRAWFDADLGVFFSHNGVIQGAAQSEYLTGVGQFQADSPATLAARMNEAPLARLAQVSFQYPRGEAVEQATFTNFRPEEAMISEKGLSTAMRDGQPRPVFQVHGHNGEVGNTGRSIHLNARDEHSRFMPICAVLNA